MSDVITRNVFEALHGNPAIGHDNNMFDIAIVLKQLRKVAQ